MEEAGFTEKNPQDFCNALDKSMKLCKRGGLKNVNTEITRGIKNFLVKEGPDEKADKFSFN